MRLSRSLAVDRSHTGVVALEAAALVALSDGFDVVVARFVTIGELFVSRARARCPAQKAECAIAHLVHLFAAVFKLDLYLSHVAGSDEADDRTIAEALPERVRDLVAGSVRDGLTIAGSLILLHVCCSFADFLPTLSQRRSP